MCILHTVLDITSFISEAFSSLFRKMPFRELKENLSESKISPFILHMYCHQEDILEECSRVFFKVFFCNLETVRSQNETVRIWK